MGEKSRLKRERRAARQAQLIDAALDQVQVHVELRKAPACLFISLDQLACLQTITYAADELAHRAHCALDVDDSGGTSDKDAENVLVEHGPLVRLTVEEAQRLQEAETLLQSLLDRYYGEAEDDDAE